MVGRRGACRQLPAWKPAHIYNAAHSIDRATLCGRLLLMARCAVLVLLLLSVTMLGSCVACLLTPDENGRRSRPQTSLPSVFTQVVASSNRHHEHYAQSKLRLG